MDKYICKAKRVDGGQWAEGLLCYNIYHQLCIQPVDNFPCVVVYPDTVCRNTEMTEFVMKDPSVCEPLFEGDIVEVWSRRRPIGENITLYRDNTTSKYDIEIKARAVICFRHGEWWLDYDNGYNSAICDLRGTEQMERTVKANPSLYGFGVHYDKNRDWFIEHNQNCKHYDIVKIGNIHENPELLEV